MPALLAVSASEGINILRNTPSILSALQDNIFIARTILDKLDCITIPSHPASPTIHICVRPSSMPPSPSPGKSHSGSSRDPAVYEVLQEERLLQEVVDEALAQGVLITRAKGLRGQELFEARPSIRLALTSSLTRKETEKAVTTVKGALVKVLGKKR